MIEFRWRTMEPECVGEIDWGAVRWSHVDLDHEAVPNTKSLELAEAGWVAIGVLVGGSVPSAEQIEDFYIVCKSKQIFPVILTSSHFAEFKKYGFQVEYHPGGAGDNVVSRQLQELWQLSAILTFERFVQAAGRIPRLPSVKPTII